MAVHGLEVHRGDKVALRDLDLEVNAGSLLSVIGPNGSGKSTLLESLAGILQPHIGEVRVAGRRPALVPQSTHVDRSLPITVRETVRLARYANLGLFKRFTRVDRLAVDRALSRLDIEHLGNRQLHELSGGQRQRVLVAQGLAQVAEVLLLDEPVIGLDIASHKLILDVLDEEVADGRTVVITTHDLDEARRSDQVLLLNTSPIACGSPAAVLTAEHLRTAFGGRFTQVGDEWILDDPHHEH